jgi:hypothetical protein
MARLSCIFRSFMFRQSCTAVSGAERTEALARDRRGHFFCLFAIVELRSREINNPDAVDLHSLWN